MLTLVAVVEPDTESEPEPSSPRNLKRKSPSRGRPTSPPTKRRRISPEPLPNCDDPSATEPDTDDEPVVPAILKVASKNATDYDSSATEPDTESDAIPAKQDDSETEPDTESDTEHEDSPGNEDDADKSARARARPAFPLAPGQKALGPLVLHPSYTYTSASAPAPVKPTNRSLFKFQQASTLTSVTTSEMEFVSSGNATHRTVAEYWVMIWVSYVVSPRRAREFTQLTA